MLARDARRDACSACIARRRFRPCSVHTPRRLCSAPRSAGSGRQPASSLRRRQEARSERQPEGCEGCEGRYSSPRGIVSLRKKGKCAGYSPAIPRVTAPVFVGPAVSRDAAPSHFAGDRERADPWNPQSSFGFSGSSAAFLRRGVVFTVASRSERNRPRSAG